MNRFSQTCIALAVCQAIAISEPHAATIVVNSTSDASSNDSNCTLREAIISANTNSNGHENSCVRGDSGDDTITFLNSLVGIDGTATISLSSNSDFSINENLTINGLGKNTLILDGLLASSIFSIRDTSATIRDLQMINARRITAGDASGGSIQIRQAEPAFENTEVMLENISIINSSTICPCTSTGGAIAVRGGSLSLINSSAADSSSVYGGGISIHSSEVEIRDSVISNNQAARGGGISITAGSLHLVNSSLLSNNYARLLGFTNGGALRAINYGSESTRVTITRSTLANNSAAYGGGIFSEDASVTIENSTISSNHAADSGGALRALDSRITSRNSTFSDNYNGAIRLVADDGVASARFTNSIIANSANGADCRRVGGTVDMGIGNIVENDGPFLSGCATSAALEVDPFLGSLSNNGGSTLTHTLLAGSPAIGAGIVGFLSCQEDDQRGVERERSICDIGAVAVDRTSSFTIIPLDNGRVVVIP